MEDPRLKSRLRVQAMLRTAATQGVIGTILRRGDADAGGILLILRHQTTLRLFTEARDPEGGAGWLPAIRGAAVDQPTADAYQARYTAADPDGWVIEFESETIPFPARLLP